VNEPQFCAGLLKSPLSRAHQIVGLVWFRYQVAGLQECSFDEVLKDLESAGLPKQNKNRIWKSISASKYLIRGSAIGKVKVNQRYIPKLEALFEPLLASPIPKIDDSVLPKETLAPRPYFQALVEQINGCHHYSWHDGAAVLMRRLVESLIIEIYVHLGRTTEIQVGGAFLMLDPLITFLERDTAIPKSRELIANVRKIKQIGDLSAHNRTYVAKKRDIDELKLPFRTAVVELATLANVLAPHRST